VRRCEWMRHCQLRGSEVRSRGRSGTHSGFLRMCWPNWAVLDGGGERGQLMADAARDGWRAGRT